MKKTKLIILIIFLTSSLMGCQTIDSPKVKKNTVATKPVSTTVTNKTTTPAPAPIQVSQRYVRIAPAEKSIIEDGENHIYTPDELKAMQYVMMPIPEFDKSDKSDTGDVKTLKVMRDLSYPLGSMRNPICLTEDDYPPYNRVKSDKTKYYFGWKMNASMNFMILPDTEQAKIDQAVLIQISNVVLDYEQKKGSNTGTMWVASKYSWILMNLENIINPQK